MKKYIRSASIFFDPWSSADLSRWSDADVQFWESIDWSARNYMPYQDTADSFQGTLKIYGLGSGTVTEKVTFVKEFSANTIYSPKYVVDDNEFAQIFDKYKERGYSLVSPMCDGRTVTRDGVTYQVADRAETVELYDALSR